MSSPHTPPYSPTSPSHYSEDVKDIEEGDDGEGEPGEHNFYVEYSKARTNLELAQKQIVYLQTQLAQHVHLSSYLY